MRVDDGQHMIPSGRNLPVVGNSDSPSEIKSQEQGEGQSKGKAKPVPSPNPTKGHAQAQARARSRSRSQTRRPAQMDRSESKAKAFAFFGQVSTFAICRSGTRTDETRTTRHLIRVRMDYSEAPCILSVHACLLESVCTMSSIPSASPKV
jgi:hypothetical protein